MRLFATPKAHARYAKAVMVHTPLFSGYGSLTTSAVAAACAATAKGPVTLPAMVAALMPCAPPCTLAANQAMQAAKQHIWALNYISSLQARGYLAVAGGNTLQSN